MIQERIPELKKLSPEEKILLAEELFTEAGYLDQVPSKNDVISQLLDQRWQHYLENPESASSWETVRENLKNKRSGPPDDQ